MIKHHVEKEGKPWSTGVQGHGGHESRSCGWTRHQSTDQLSFKIRPSICRSLGKFGSFPNQNSWPFLRWSLRASFLVGSLLGRLNAVKSDKKGWPWISRRLTNPLVDEYQALACWCVKRHRPTISRWRSQRKCDASGEDFFSHPLASSPYTNKTAPVRYACKQSEAQNASGKWVE